MLSLGVDVLDLAPKEMRGLVFGIMVSITVARSSGPPTIFPVPCSIRSMTRKSRSSPVMNEALIKLMLGFRGIVFSSSRRGAAEWFRRHRPQLW